jgi:hypothetical protein
MSPEGVPSIGEVLWAPELELFLACLRLDPRLVPLVRS